MSKKELTGTFAIIISPLFQNKTNQIFPWCLSYLRELHVSVGLNKRNDRNKSHFVIFREM